MTEILVFLLVLLSPSKSHVRLFIYFTKRTVYVNILEYVEQLLSIVEGCVFVQLVLAYVSSLNFDTKVTIHVGTRMVCTSHECSETRI
jgi:hypothetical protein